MFIKNLLRILLIISLIVLICASCENKEESSTHSLDDTSESQGDDVFEEVPVLPDKTYGGRTIKIAAASETLWGNELICPEAEDGEQVNDATFRRNKTVEERFDVNLEQVDIEFTIFETTFKNSVMAGDNIFDFAFPRLYHAVPLAASGYLADFNGIPY
ncbi:MAG: hypothetical protein FWH48_02085, partial [Oscillospiraceae bacterium]|nr:hypothetical protein [Oscillospiraceae bacterium]